MPQDVRLSPDGRTFLVADMMRGGLWEVDADDVPGQRVPAHRAGAHGIYPSRDGRDLYVSNRGAGSISVVDAATLRVGRCGSSPAAARPTWAASRPTAGSSGSPAATTASST